MPVVRRYSVLIEQEDDVFVVTCPALPGCASYGETHAEALANIAEAIEGMLIVMQKYGDPIPDPAKFSLESVEVAV